MAEAVNSKKSDFRVRVLMERLRYDYFVDPGLKLQAGLRSKRGPEAALVIKINERPGTQNLEEAATFSRTSGGREERLLLYLFSASASNLVWEPM